MEKIKFIKEGPDKKGKTYIIEGIEKDGHAFSVRRLICEVQQQETEDKTQEVADLLLKKLNAYN